MGKGSTVNSIPYFTLVNTRLKPAIHIKHQDSFQTGFASNIIMLALTVLRQQLT